MHGSSSPRAEPNGRRVLVVEPPRAGTGPAAEALAGAGHAVSVAPAAIDALRSLDEHGPPDLLVIAVRLGPLSPLDLAAVVRPRWPTLPVVLVGVSRDDVDAGRLRALGGVHLVEPPFDAATLRAAAARALEPEPVPAGGKALVVDDHPAVRAVVVDALAEGGFDVVEAAGYAEALVHLADDLAVVVTDLDLGAGPSGLELVAAARSRLPGLLVVAMSADPQLLQAAALRGAGALLAKPFGVADLRRAAGLPPLGP